MSKEVIKVDGNDVIVRDDTAKAYRGVNWAIMVSLIALAIMILFAVVFFLRASTDGKIESPAQASNANIR